MPCFFTALATASLLPGAESLAQRREGTAAQETLRWRLPVAFGTQLPALGDNILTVRDALAESSAGALTLEVFEPGEIVSTFAITEAVRLDKVPAGYTWLGYDQGRTPPRPSLGPYPSDFPLGPTWPGGTRGRENSWPGGLSRPGPSPDPLRPHRPGNSGVVSEAHRYRRRSRGLKIRFAGLGGKTLQALGASVTMIPGSDLFQALEKGGHRRHRVFPAGGGRQTGLSPGGPHQLLPRLAPTLHGLPPGGEPSALEPLGTGQPKRPRDRMHRRGDPKPGARRGLQGAVLERFQREGVDTRVLDPALLETLRTAAQTVLAEEAAADPTFARVYANQQRFAERYAVWDALAYPPNAAP